MPDENRRSAGPLEDPRTRLLKTAYFTLRPRPLERWLWSLKVSQATERVFWLHWAEGARSGDWCSEIPVRVVARECGIDTATVSRAYQTLRKLGVLRREDPGRDPANPFQQATAITEIRLPPAFLAAWQAAPRRPVRQTGEPSAAVDERPVTAAPAGVAPASEGPDSGTAPTPPDTIGRQEALAIMQKLSSTEKAAYQAVLSRRRVDMTFDAVSRLSPAEQAYLVRSLAVRLTPAAPVRPPPSPGGPASREPRRAGRPLTPMELARIRRRVVAVTPGEEGVELARQVAWSLESGALARFDREHGLHIALKKIRTGLWTRPNRMPPNWMRLWATPETRSVA